jgi:hypothetical protein
MAKAAPLNHLVWRVLSVLAVLAGLAALTATAQVVQPKAPEGQTATPLSVERASAGDSPSEACTGHHREQRRGLEWASPRVSLCYSVGAR